MNVYFLRIIDTHFLSLNIKLINFMRSLWSFFFLETTEIRLELFDEAYLNEENIDDL